MEPILITIVQGDKQFEWDFTLTDAQGVAVNLTSSALYFRCQSVSDPSVNFKNAMSIVSAVAGTCKYVAGNNDFLVAGTYNAQIVVEYTSGEIISFNGITINVQPKLPADPTN